MRAYFWVKLIIIFQVLMGLGFGRQSSELTQGRESIRTHSRNAELHEAAPAVPVGIKSKTIDPLRTTGKISSNFGSELVRENFSFKIGNHKPSVMKL